MALPFGLKPEKELVMGQPGSNSSELFIAEGPYPNVRFILLSLENLLKLGLTIWQALQICANSCSETGYGVARFVGFNFGGVKLSDAFVKDYKKNHNNEDPFWWQAPGHINSGDQEICYYRTYKSPADYYDQWNKKFVPKNGSGRYKKTGEVFWQNDEKWFLELCLAGYKGEITEANPEPSFKKHKEVVKRCMVLVCQILLGCKPDANWGTNSKKKAGSFILASGLNLTTEPTFELFSKLVSSWQSSGYPKPIFASLL